MTNLNPITVAARKRKNLTVRFFIVAVLVSAFIVISFTALVHQQMRSLWLGTNLEQLAGQINDGISVATRSNSGDIDRLRSSDYWRFISSLQGVKAGAFFDSRMALVWGSEPGMDLTTRERTNFPAVARGPELSRIIDQHLPGFSSPGAFFGDSHRAVSGLIPLKDNSGQLVGMLKLVGDYDIVLQNVAQSVKQIFWYILGATVMLLATLFYSFKRGLKTIENREEQLNQQISGMSNLLSINRDMQKNMKIASRRAVELNEHFLRRVGSDLHDGPAQLIGYSVMRLDRVSKDERSKELSEEFHVVKEALDGALKEIRDISSGLVLPELEHMTLEQALDKVISRNSVNSDTNVVQYYKDLPDQIPLPIKICVYRFVQEGLNNANRHGKAEKCRVSAYVKDDMLHLSLKDNGIGFRKSQLSTEGGHLGLMGLKDRIESLGGTFSINSKLGVGTAIKATLALTDDIWPDQNREGQT